jgi:rhodanese-related sulfurtransferase
MTEYHKPLALIAAVLGLTAWAADSPRRSGPARDYISAPELAERIMGGDAALQVFDLRSEAAFAQFHIPGARRAIPDDLTKESFPRDAAIVLYSEGGADAAQGRMHLGTRGHPNVLFLREGVYEWISRVFDPRLATDATPAERAVFERAATMSRYFGGVPRVDVPRSEVPAGYWTGAAASSGSTKQTITGIRRRGC